MGRRTCRRCGYRFAFGDQDLAAQLANALEDGGEVSRGRIWFVIEQLFRVCPTCTDAFVTQLAGFLVLARCRAFGPTGRAEVIQ